MVFPGVQSLRHAWELPSFGGTDWFCVTSLKCWIQLLVGQGEQQNSWGQCHPKQCLGPWGAQAPSGTDTPGLSLCLQCPQQLVPSRWLSLARRQTHGRGTAQLLPEARAGMSISTSSPHSGWEEGEKPFILRAAQSQGSWHCPSCDRRSTSPLSQCPAQCQECVWAQKLLSVCWVSPWDTSSAHSSAQGLVYSAELSKCWIRALLSRLHLPVLFYCRRNIPHLLVLS